MRVADAVNSGTYSRQSQRGWELREMRIDGEIGKNS